MSSTVGDLVDCRNLFGGAGYFAVCAGLNLAFKSLSQLNHHVGAVSKARASELDLGSSHAGSFPGSHVGDDKVVAHRTDGAHISVAVVRNSHVYRVVPVGVGGEGAGDGGGEPGQDDTLGVPEEHLAPQRPEGRALDREDFTSQWRGGGWRDRAHAGGQRGVVVEAAARD